MSKVFRILLGVFLGLAVMFMAIGAGIGYAHFRGTEGYIPVTGVITGFTSGQMPIVTYSAQGYTGTVRSHTRISWQRLGDEVTVMVDPRDPSRVSDSSLRIVSIVFVCIGGVMLLACLVTAIAARAVRKKREELLVWGQRVTVTIDAINVNTMVTMMNRHPERLYAHCVHPVTGETVKLHSHDLWKTPLQPGDRVDVLFDPMNEKRYVFDVREDA